MSIAYFHKFLIILHVIHFHDFREREAMTKTKTVLMILAVLIVTLACSIGQPSSIPTPTSAGVQQQQNQQPVTLPTDTTQPLPPVEQPTSPSLPTLAPLPTYTSLPTDTLPAPSETPQDMMERIRNANILVFEDIRSTSLVPIVHRALAALGVNHAVEVGDALGNFQNYIYGPTKWDLIIVAAEARSVFKGEMFDGLVEKMDDGVGVVIELWYLGDIINGRIAPIMQRCGLGWQKSLNRNTSYDPYNYSFLWLDSSDPLISTPNVVPEPSYPYPVWFGKAGDLMNLKPGSTSKLIAGMYRDTKDSYGGIASCLNGRVYIQTFSSHDYAYNTMEPLWENYIVNALTNHFNYQP